MSNGAGKRKRPRVTRRDVEAAKRALRRSGLRHTEDHVQQLAAALAAGDPADLAALFRERDRAKR